MVAPTAGNNAASQGPPVAAMAALSAWEQRAEPRYPFVLKIEVRPLDGGLNPLGEFRPAVVRDISARGVRMYASVPEGTRYLHARFVLRSGESAEGLIEALRVEPSDFTEMSRIGGRLVETPPAVAATPG